jgi:hypothetical protein
MKYHIYCNGVEKIASFKHISDRDWLLEELTEAYPELKFSTVGG